ncbi:MAG: DUF3108 domain-containing protein [Marinifilaceae bacterium]
MRSIRTIAILLVLGFSYLGTRGQCLESNFAFQPGERLNYTGYYNWGFIWVAAGEVNLSVGDSEYKGNPAYKITAEGRSLKAFDWFFKLRDTLTSYVDPSTLAPFHFDRQTNEAKYKARHLYDFDYENQVIYSNIRKKSKPALQDTVALTPCTFDLLTVAYYARNINFSNYKKGDKIPLTMLVDNEINSLYIRYLGIDVVKAKNGERFECLKFSPLLVKGTMFKGGEDMTVWMSNDQNRIPIMVEAKVLVGSVKGVLTSYEGLRSTTNSWFKRKHGRMEIAE